MPNPDLKASFETRLALFVNDRYCRATRFASYDGVETSCKPLGMRAFTAALEALERDVLARTHPATLEGRCTYAALFLATAFLTDLAIIFLAIKLKKQNFSSSSYLNDLTSKLWNKWK